MTSIASRLRAARTCIAASGIGALVIAALALPAAATSIQPTSEPADQGASATSSSEPVGPGTSGSDPASGDPGTSPPADPGAFNHVGTFDVPDNLGDGEGIGTPTVAEIVDVSEDGMTLVYTDALAGRIGFVDITDTASPAPLGTIEAEGDPTSVGVAGKFVYAAVNTGDFVDPSGTLLVIDLATRTIESELDLAGQPDSVAVSPDGTFLVVVIENERDEDLDAGLIPQLPAGTLQVFRLIEGMIDDDPVDVDLTGLAETAAEDPEPEFVDINDENVAIVTMQENNHLAVVDLETATVTADFPAGTTTIENVDIADDSLIEYTESVVDRRREPDAVAWLDTDTFVTANEGDYTDSDGVEGGSRSFTIFDTTGEVVFESGSSFEHQVAGAGHYPDGRSDAKGVEPEGVEVAVIAGRTLLFVGSERGNAVGVYDMSTGTPRFLQLLPTGMGPEGITVIVERGLLIVSAEVDGLAEEPDDQFPVRSMITLYELGDGPARYPYLVSDDVEGTPIPWVAISGLSGDPIDAETVWAVSDSFLAQAWIYRIETGGAPARITERIAVGGPDGSLDLEGIAARPEGGFWLASEGDAEERANQIVQVEADGTIVGEPIGLPSELVANQTSNGFEGVTVTGTEEAGDETVWVAIQREWADDAAGFVKLGRYDVATGAWSFAAYPLDPVESANGGWVGLSEVTALDDGMMAVVERDNQLGFDAAIKRIYIVDPAGVTFVPYGEELAVLGKTLYADVLAQLDLASVSVPDKLEGVALTSDGTWWLATDNDGVDGNFGETIFVPLDQ